MPPADEDGFIPFKSIDTESDRYNKILRNHGLKVLNTISKMVRRINNDEKMLTVATSVGERHRDYNANARLIVVSQPGTPADHCKFYSFRLLLLST